MRRSWRERDRQRERERKRRLARPERSLLYLFFLTGMDTLFRRKCPLLRTLSLSLSLPPSLSLLPPLKRPVSSSASAPSGEEKGFYMKERERERLKVVKSLFFSRDVPEFEADRLLLWDSL